MKKQILSLIMVLALIFGVCNFAMAANTNGSIDFTGGGVIIHPPGDEDIGDYEYEGEEGEDGDSEEFLGFDFGGNLYFGSHTIGDFGTYDSSNVAQTTNTGTHTGLQVVNFTANVAKISVAVSEFSFGAGKVLKGAELDLKAYELECGAFFLKSQMTHGGGLLSSDPTEILVTASGSRVRASWTGELGVLPGTAIYSGNAQATLTWTDTTGTP